MVQEIEIYRFTRVYSLLTKKVSDYKKLQFWKFCSYSFPCRSCTAAWSSWKRVCKRMRCSVGRVPFLPTTSLGWTSSSGPLSPSRRCVIHYRQNFFPFNTFFLEHSFMLKSYWWWGGWVAHVIIVSPQSQLDLDFDFGLVWGWVWV